MPRKAYRKSFRTRLAQCSRYRLRPNKISPGACYLHRVCVVAMMLPVGGPSQRILRTANLLGSCLSLTAKRLSHKLVKDAAYGGCASNYLRSPPCVAFWAKIAGVGERSQCLRSPYSPSTVRVQSEYIQNTFRVHSEYVIYRTLCTSCFKKFNNH